LDIDRRQTADERAGIDSIYRPVSHERQVGILFVDHVELSMLLCDA
jgi:hypothetical protein